MVWGMKNPVENMPPASRPASRPLSESELDTVLAALDYWNWYELSPGEPGPKLALATSHERNGFDPLQDIREIANWHGPRLNADQVDDLTVRLNTCEIEMECDIELSKACKFLAELFGQYADR